MDFLKDFDKRMKSVGRYVMLMKNSFQKGTWKTYEVNEIDEQMNILFTVLLYVMEYSLREEDCTIDDIAGFLEEINDKYYRKDWSYEDCKKLADFIINEILGNSGNAMYFKGYQYDKKEYMDIPVSYVANKIVYQENGVRRASYHLTDEGYCMVLATMELENNQKLTVYELLFKMHLEKADYSRAVDYIKRAFDQLRIQNQKIEEAMRRIRRNALSYTVEEYRQLVEENMDTIERTRADFKSLRETVEAKVQEFEEKQIHADRFDEKEKENLKNLRTINSYLNKALDEHQKILSVHFDLKSLYAKELENYSNMTLVQRFSFQTEIYDRVLQDASLLENAKDFLMPLFLGKPQKYYNPGKAFDYQKRYTKSAEDEDVVTIGEESGDSRQEEYETKMWQKQKKYAQSLEVILSLLAEKKEITVADLKEEVFKEKGDILIPTGEIFREIMIELLTAGYIDTAVIRKERKEHLESVSEGFELNELLVQVMEHDHAEENWKIHIDPGSKEDVVYFYPVKDENGEERTMKCANVHIWYESE